MVIADPILYKSFVGGTPLSKYLFVVDRKDKEIVKRVLPALDIYGTEHGFAATSEDISTQQIIDSLINYRTALELPPNDFCVLSDEPFQFDGFHSASIKHIQSDEHKTSLISSIVGFKEKVEVHRASYYCLYTIDEILWFLNEVLPTAQRWSIDIESTSFSPFRKEFLPFTISFTKRPGESYAFGLFHPQAQLRFWRKYYWVYQLLVKRLADPYFHWVGHNILSFDKPGLEHHFGFRMTKSFRDAVNRIDDTKMKKYTLDESSKSFYRLKDSGVYELGWKPWGIDTSDLAREPLDQVLYYNCQDTDATLQVDYAFDFRMSKNSSFYGVDLHELYRNVHLPNAINAGLLDSNGIQADIEYAQTYKDFCDRAIIQLTDFLRTLPPVQQLEEQQFQAALGLRKKKPLPGTTEYDAFRARFNFLPGKVKLKKILLFDILQLPYPEECGRTEKGNDVRVNDDVLQFLSNDDNLPEALKGSVATKICKALARIAGMSVDLSSYVRPVLINHSNSKDGLSHASFRATGTETGRYSCKNADVDVTGCGENLQKINKRKEIKQLYRSRFRTNRAGQAVNGKILEIDGQAAEIRMAANHTICSRAVLSRRSDPGYIDLKFHYRHRDQYLAAAEKNNLIKVFKTGEDVHTMGTCLIMDKPRAQEYLDLVLNRITPDFKIPVTKDERAGGKFCTLGRMYARGSDAIAAQYGVDPVLMAERVAAWDRIFPEFTRNWHPAVKEYLRKKGYVTSLFGLVRRIPDVWSEEKKWASKAEREGINSPVQGDSHMWISKAISWFQENVLDQKPWMKSVIINDVHDAFLVDAHPDEVEIVGVYMGAAMMHCAFDTDRYPWMVCPLASDLKVYDTYWGNTVAEIKYDSAFMNGEKSGFNLIEECERIFTPKWESLLK